MKLSQKLLLKEIFCKGSKKLNKIEIKVKKKFHTLHQYFLCKYFYIFL